MSPMTRTLPVFFLSLLVLGCASGPSKDMIPDLRTFDIGLRGELKAHLVAEGLCNPTHVSFNPNGGALTICDSGNGRILVIDRQTTVLREGFATEYWKKISVTENFFKIGPLFALWVDAEKLAIGDGGLADGKESVFFFKEGAGRGSTNALAPTSDPPRATDPGEGNFVGPVLAPDGNTIYAASHGDDEKSWIVAIDVKARTLRPLFSSDESGIKVNAPMQCLLVRDNLLVLYSGAGGVEDGLVVEYDLKTFKPVDQWKLPGIVDPMSIAPIPGKVDEYIVTDNNWDLRSVKSGKLARVKLSPRLGAEVEVIADQLKGPVYCAFGLDRRLYVTCLGEMYDQDKGMVLAISGIK
jgi:hypothetical protein